MPGREGLQDERARGIVPFDQFPGPVVIPPADIQDTPGLCLRVNATWAALLSSLLDRLDQPDVWAGDETQIDDARQRVRALQVLLDGINDCMCIDDFTASAETGEPVSVTYNPATNNFHFVIPPGEDGAPGPMGIQGPAGPAGENSGVITSPPPDLSSMVDPRCAISTFIREELEDAVGNVLDTIDSAADLTEAIITLVGSFIQMGPLAQPIAAVVDAAAGLTTTVIRAGLNTQAWDNIQCDLHCNLDSSDPILSAEVRGLWALDVDSRDVLGVYSFVALCINMWSQSGWDYLAWRSQFVDDSAFNCSFCSCVDQFNAIAAPATYGTVVSRTFPTANRVEITVESEYAGGSHRLRIEPASPDTCMKVISRTVNSGQPTYFNPWWCAGGYKLTVALPDDEIISNFESSTTGPFSVTFVLERV